MKRIDRTIKLYSINSTWWTHCPWGLGFAFIGLNIDIITNGVFKDD